ncbi:MAG: hypothetical protein GX621_04115 [Pirellulaceae bacterium]|nr:hypothetical protein [Pirellulaceae bacterium]
MLPSPKHHDATESKSVVNLSGPKPCLWLSCLLAAIICFAGSWQPCHASYSGLLVSATSNTPVELGDSLTIDITVKNAGTDWWEYWDYPGWISQALSPSWSTPWSDITYYCWDDVAPGSYAYRTMTLGSSDLPFSAGDYSIQVKTYYNKYDNGTFYLMSGCPKTVSFSIVDVPPDIPGDATGDRVVDDADAEALAANWGKPGGWAQGDFNNDGVINALDAAILAAHWRHGVGGETTELAVPEPSLLMLLLGLILPLLIRRRMAT